MSYNATQCAEYLLDESNPETMYTNYLEPEEYDKLFEFFNSIQVNMTDENTHTLKVLTELANSGNETCQ